MTDQQKREAQHIRAALAWHYLGPRPSPEGTRCKSCNFIAYPGEYLCTRCVVAMRRDGE